MTWFSRLVGMHGRLALMSEAEAGLLARAAETPGDHVEIGCLWGGTALIAALAKQDAGVSGSVLTIDPMAGGWWDTSDPVTGTRVTPGAVLDNLRCFGVAHRVNIIRASSFPWPLPPEVTPATILIDGDHSFEGCARDWRTASERAGRYILVHDYSSARHPGVTRALNEYAAMDDRFTLADVADTLALFERVAP